MPEIQWAINSYQARALPLSAQRIVNFYAEQAPKDAKSPVVLLGAPGIKSFNDNVGDGPIRGFDVMDDLLYAMSGCVLYSIDSTGRAISLGSICNAAAGGSSVAQGATQEASASFEITAGSVGSANTVSSITVGGVEILGAAVDFDTDNETTAAAIASDINQTKGWDVSTAVYENVSFDVSALETFPLVLGFSKDGTKMYVGGHINETIYQWNLSLAWDITSAVDSGFSLGIQSELGDNNISAIALSDDGTKLYAVGPIGSTVYQYTLPTPFSLLNSSYSSLSFSVNTQESSPDSVFVSSAGDKLYIVGHNSDKMYQYTITIGNVSTANYDDVSLDVSSEMSPTGSGLANGLFFNPSGKQFFISGDSLTGDRDSVWQYDLTTAWDLSTAAYVNKKFVTTNEGTALSGVHFKSDGTKMFLVDPTNNNVFEYSIKTIALSFTAIANGAVVTFQLTDDSGEANGLPVIITTTGDVQVDDPTTTLEGGFSMPAIITTSGGGGIPLTNPACVSMSHNQASTSQLCIVDGTNGWIYDVTNGLQQITDGDFFSADVVDFQDQYFVFNKAGTGRFFLSNLNDGLIYTATDIATAEGDPDNLVTLISNRRELWLFGAETIEIWYNAGGSDFPFSRFEGGFLERGCAAAFSIAEDDNAIFWLGEDRIIYRADGYTPQRISQHGIEEAIRKYTIVSDACAFIYTMGGHKFYVCTFPAEDATWVYDITTGLWHERQSVGMGRWRVNTHVEAYGKHLVGDFEKGRIGELDLDTFEEYGEVMQGQATGPPVYADRQRIFHRRFELDIDAGPGLTSGQGSDPQVWLDYSDDGGHTWSARKPFRSMGKIGTYLTRLRWLRLGSARQRIYRLTVSDPVVRSIVAAHLDAEAADH
jgi:hypothetical protein